MSENISELDIGIVQKYLPDFVNLVDDLFLVLSSGCMGLGERGFRVVRIQEVVVALWGLYIRLEDFDYMIMYSFKAMGRKSMYLARLNVEMVLLCELWDLHGLIRCVRHNKDWIGRILRTGDFIEDRDLDYYYGVMIDDVAAQNYVICQMVLREIIILMETHFEYRKDEQDNILKAAIALMLKFVEEYVLLLSEMFKKFIYKNGR